MFNKFGRLRFGWQPKRLSAELACPMQHIRVGETDFLVAIQKDGVVFAWDKFANTISGFPVSLHEQVNNFSLHQGDSLSVAHIKILSAKGLLFKVNLLGKVIGRNQLPNTQSIAIFTQCNDETGSSYMVYARQEGKRISIFQPNGELYFNQEFKTGYEKSIQYYHFNEEAQLIAITDKKTRHSYLYYMSGELIQLGSFESDQTVSIHYDSHSQAYYLTKCYGKRVEAIKLEL